MKPVVLSCVIFLGCCVSTLRAGSVVTIADGLETTGKLTLTSSTISVETSSSPKEINLSDILAADFRETPFQLDCFLGGGNQLPATWKAQDIGAVAHPGSVVYTDGTFTLSGSGGDPGKESKVSDKLFFAGQPWTGNGQWTARVREIDLKTPATAGLMLRDTLDAGSAKFSLEAGAGGIGGFAFRNDAGKGSQEIWSAIWHGAPIPMNLPIWLRFTRYGASVFAAISSDGKEWNLLGQYNPRILASPWIGIFAQSYHDKLLGNVVIDQVCFTPAPSSAQVLPPGVLLRSGTFLAGAFNSLVSDPANPDANGNFNRAGKPVAIPRSKIAAVTMLPTARSQIADMGSHIGLLMKNGDVMDGEPEAISGGAVRARSVLLGIITYERSDVRACILHPLQAQPASYEIRLKDGSIVNATDLNINKGEVVIQEVSGVSVSVSPDEIAQFRAGSSQVQSLAELNWKATPPPAAPVTNAAPVAQAVPDQLPPVQCWEGQNQEQILEAPVGTALEFPLTSKFRALAMRIALSPDSPPNSQVTLRVLANGKEIGRTPPFRAGDQPRFMEVTLQPPRTVTFEADSIFVGPKVLFIDPVAIRDIKP